MRPIFTRALCALAALGIACSFTACGASSKAMGGVNSSESRDSAPSEPMAPGAEPEYGWGDDPAAEMPKVQDNRKLIYTSSLDIQTLEYDAHYAAVLDLIAAQGGYVSESESWGVGLSADGTRHGSRSCRITARIPADNYAAFMAGAGSIGNLSNKSEQVRDVTGEYVDVESRLASLETQRLRLEELAAEAGTLEDMLTIEQRLSEVIYQIESYTAQRNTYDDLISYSTVTVNLDEVRQYTPTPTHVPTFWEELWQQVKDTAWDFVLFLKELLFFVIRVSPYLALGVLIWLALRPLVKRSRARRAARPQRATPVRAPYQYGAQPAQPQAPEAAPADNE